MKLKYFTLLLVLPFVQVQALVINEVMYDPSGADTGREWVEIYNDGGVSINLTSYKLFESGTNHGITSYSGGTSIDANGMGIIADNAQKFLLDYPQYTGVLYDSAFSLVNTGEQLILKDASLATVDQVTYSTSFSGDDGSTVSLLNGIWGKGNGTPGRQNESWSGTVTTTSSTTENQTTLSQVSPPSADIVLYLPIEKMVVAGAETEFLVSSMTRSGKVIDGITYSWAFGDGGQGTGAFTTYTYAYPGNYIVLVGGTSNSVAGVGRINVHVVAPEINISDIGVGKYGSYLKISNPHTYDVDISGWRLVINGETFLFPKNTLLGKYNTTIISGRAMGFASSTISSSSVIKILFPNLEEVTRFSPIINSPIVLGTSTTVKASQVLPTVVLKPIVKIIKATTTSQQATTTLVQKSPQTIKDKRIVSWFKSLFSK